MSQLFPTSTSFLGLEGLHVFVTSAAGGIGSQVIEEFLDQRCKVTALDTFPLQIQEVDRDRHTRLNLIGGKISDEESIRSSFEQATRRFGPVNILVTNSGILDERIDGAIWDMPLEAWEAIYQVNARGVFLAIKHFLQSARTSQDKLGSELNNLSIVVMGKVGHGEDAQCALVRGVKNEIGQLNNRARINAVVPGSDVVKTQDITRAMAFLTSHRAAGHISGQCLRVDTRMGDRLVWIEDGVMKTTTFNEEPGLSITRWISKPKNKIRIAVSVDLDAVSGWLGTGQHSDNTLADYSSGFFAAKVGVPRLLRMLKKLDLADRCTWFIPGHSAESFPEEVRQVIDAGCEIGLHGYAHEGSYQLTVEQERDVLAKCIDIATNLTGKRPVGYRAPLYQVRESTLDLLEEFGFEYDASLTDHDCHPFFAPRRPPIKPIDFSLPASSWMRPVPQPPTDRRPLVCIPCNWYMEDMTPMQYLPHVPNSHGYVDTRVVENLWRDRFHWIRENEKEPVFPIVAHPDTSGMAHIIGMLERMLTWLKGWGDEVEFCQMAEIARRWREKKEGV